LVNRNKLRLVMGDIRKIRIVNELFRLQFQESTLPTAHRLCKEVEKDVPRNTALKRLEELKDSGIVKEAPRKKAKGKESEFSGLQLDPKVYNKISLTMLALSPFHELAFEVIEISKKKRSYDTAKFARAVVSLCLLLMGKLIDGVIRQKKQYDRDIMIVYGCSLISETLESFSDSLKAPEDTKNAIDNIKKVFAPHISKADLEYFNEVLSRAKDPKRIRLKTLLAKAFETQ